MKKLLLTMACLGLIISTSGCAGSGSSLLCGFQDGPFRNGPVRNQIRSWFRGDECSTCDAPAGQQLNYGTNVAPLCESCGNPYPQASIDGQQFYSGDINQGQLTGQLYDNPVLNAPIYGNATPAIMDGSSVQGIVGSPADGAITADPGILPPQGF